MSGVLDPTVQAGSSADRGTSAEAEAAIPAQQEDPGSSTEFEKLYADFCSEIDLLGPVYETVRKAVFYSILGEVIKGGRRNEIGVVAVDAKKWSDASQGEFGSIRYRRDLDTRLSLRIFIHPGHGKKQIEEVFKKCAKAVGHSIRSPDSFHSEQFVGKVLTPPRVEEREIKFGFLAYDIVMINEAKGLWTQKGHQDTRKHLRTACDPIGTNDLEKENVDAKMGEVVHYYPAPTTVTLCQPCQLDSDLISLGDLRRGPIVYAPRLSEEEEEEIDAMFHDMGEHRDPKASERLFQSLKDLSTERHDFDLEGYSAEIQEYHRELKTFSRSLANGNASAEAYVDAARFDILYWFLRMVCLRAAVGRREEPSSEDFARALKDLESMLENGIRFVKEFISPEGQTRGSLVDKKWRFLELVWKYTGRDADYICQKAEEDRLMNAGRPVTMNSARQHYYYKLRKEGLINQDPKSVELTGEGRKRIDVE